jgi:uncharacterized protein
LIWQPDVSAVDPRRRGLLALLMLAGQGIVKAAPDEPAATAVSRDWLRALHAWALPRHEQLLASAEALLQAIYAARQSPAAEPADAEMQTAWRRTMLAWRRLEALQFGAALQRRSSRKLDFWPTRPPSIEQSVLANAGVPEEGTEAERWLSRLGVAVKGLPALEWLLFGDGDGVPLRRSPAHGLYARRLIREVLVEARVLRDAWVVEAARWETASDAEVQRALQDILNLMVGSCELLRGKKLQKAARLLSLGGRDAGLPSAFDSVRSGQTRAFLQAHLEALLQLLLGRHADLPFSPESPEIGLTDVLSRRGAAELGRSLHVPATRAYQAALALPLAPQQWSLPRVEPLANALRELRSRIDPPIAALLGIVITFTDADGD